MEDSVKRKSLSIEEWCAYANAGVDIPITIQLSGYSMQPLIRYKKDYVTIVPLHREVKIGDIVVFLNTDGRYCAHRVNKIRDGKVLTLGDNCYLCDSWKTPDKLLGLVVSMERNGKKYNLDCGLARAYGKLHISLLPLRKLKKNIIQFLWKYYVRFFKRKDD